MTRLPECLQTARDALLNITPMKKDCGKLCGAACCQPGEEGAGGMILFPGEEVLYDPCDWATVTDSGVCIEKRPLRLLACNGHCDRTVRPLACRIFPLTPYVSQGRLQILMDVRAWPVCPLMASGIQGLSAAFVETVRGAMRALWRDEACRAYMVELTKRIDAYRRF